MMSQSKSALTKERRQSIRSDLSGRGFDTLFLDDFPSYRGTYRVIAIKKHHLAEGRYGKIYEAYPFNIEKNIIDVDTKFAVKRFRKPKDGNFDDVIDEIKQESKIYSRYNKAENLFQINDALNPEILFLMSYIPGEELYNDTVENRITISKTLLSLNYHERITAIVQLLLRITLMHNQTPSTGPVIFHGDLKGVNIKIYRDLISGQINIYVLDFGFASELQIASDDMSMGMDAKGTPVYMAPERIDRRGQGTKSDTYALIPILSVMLNAKNPLEKKDSSTLEKVFYVPYVFDDILSDLELPNFPFQLYNILIDLLHAMQSEYEKRPSSEELLRFFTSLNVINKLYLINKDDPDIICHAAQMALICCRLWLLPVSNLDIKLLQILKDVLPNVKLLDNLEQVFFELKFNEKAADFYEHILDFYQYKSSDNFLKSSGNHSSLFASKHTKVGTQTPTDVQKCTII